MESIYAAEALLLGPPVLRMSAQRIEPPASKLMFVPFYLAYAGGWVPRVEVATLLWGDQTDAAAFRNLRQMLFRLRQKHAGRSLEIEDHRLRFIGQSDVGAFEACIAREAWRDALDVYRGPFMEGWSFPRHTDADAWIVRCRSDVDSKVRRARAEAAKAMRPDAPVAAAELYGQMWRADVSDEAALREQLGLLQRAGRMRAAADAAAEYRQTLQRELDVEPIGDLADLLDHAEARRAVRSAATEGLRSELPSRGDMVGRHDEIAAIEAVLASDASRLVSIVGLGGSGKTRLATEVAHRARARGKEAAWVSLLGLQSSEDLLAASARACGMDSSPRAAAGLARHLGDRDVLLVLDNAEHMVGEVSALAGTLLDPCPGLRIVVTSREMLPGPEARIVPLHGLELGDGGEAMELFLRRAERLGSPIDVERNGSTVAAICHAVGGMPLALELIAAWADVLPAEEMLRTVQEESGTVTTSPHPHAIPDRHRSLQTVMDATWERLTPRARDALIALAPAEDGMSFQDARLIGIELGALRDLADAMVVHRDGRRLTLHPLVARHARDVAQRSGDAWASARARHASHFLGKLESIASLPASDSDPLMTDVANLRTALLWGAEHADAKTFDHALQGFNRLQDSHGLPADVRFSERLYASATGAKRIHAGLRLVWVLLFGADGDYGVTMGFDARLIDQAATLARAAYEDAHSLDDPRLIRLGLDHLAMVANLDNRPRDALDYARRASRSANGRRYATLADRAGHAYEQLGRFGAARIAFLRAVAIGCQRSGPSSLPIRWPIYSIAAADMMMGDYASAARVVAAIRAHIDTYTPDRWRCEALAIEGEAAIAMGRFDDATRALELAIRLAQDVSAEFRDTRGSMLHGLLGYAWTLAGRTGAEDHVQASEGTPFEWDWRGRLALADGDFAAARDALSEAVARVPVRTHEVSRFAAGVRARSWLAMAFARLGQTDEAQRAAVKALSIAVERSFSAEAIRSVVAVAAAFDGVDVGPAGVGLQRFVRSHPAADADARILAGGTAVPPQDAHAETPALDRARDLLDALRSAGHRGALGSTVSR